ncbi:ORC1-type DNA replication protein [Methanocalculus sp.]|uniref:ORC1-type DNA replication protein n=1 Tax=Methanocalculus sp. TaxID=2004547 RepID=UPI00271A99FC|nr:ORC1-type DNA replication protein [Methanocalculus sp.]MDO8841352.1 ORC1-type DNA replication protein [Methanocalculus sp.]
MRQRFLLSDQTLFKNPDILEFDYMPDQISFREMQLADLAFRIRPGMAGMRPVNILCRGLPGTGKTTCIHHLFSEIEEATKRLVPVYVNCQNDRTKYSVYSRIYSKLLGHAPPRTGVAVSRLMDAIAKVMVERDIVLLICLDDLHYLMYEDVLNSVLYSLLRMYLDYPGCRVSVIMCESDLDLDLSRAVDGSVSSSLCAEEVSFPPYSGDEIRAILKDRMREAIWPGVISAEMLDLIVLQTQKAADLRVGLDLLKRSVLKAEWAARSTVVREDIVYAYGDASLVRLRETVRVLSDKERCILRIIADLRSYPVVTSGMVFARVQDLGGVCYTSFYERVKTLEKLGLVQLTVRQAKGRTSEIRLRYEAEEVEKVCGGKKKG